MQTLFKQNLYLDNHSLLETSGKGDNIIFYFSGQGDVENTCIPGNNEVLQIAMMIGSFNSNH